MDKNQLLIVIQTIYTVDMCTFILSTNSLLFTRLDKRFDYLAIGHADSHLPICIEKQGFMALYVYFASPLVTPKISIDQPSQAICNHPLL
jgi:hypothetical protein